MKMASHLLYLFISGFCRRDTGVLSEESDTEQKEWEKKK